MNRQLHCIFLFIIITSLPFKGKSQQQDSLKIVSGEVVRIMTHTPIAMAHIQIKNKRRITTCDTLGYFSLYVSCNDTLLISAIGYQKKSYPIINITDEELPFVNISLLPVSYILEQVDILAFKNYNEFKSHFLKLKLPEPEYKINESIYKGISPYNRKPQSKIPPMYRARFNKNPDIITALFFPTDFAYYHLSKRQRSKRKVSQLIREEKTQKIISQKFNSQIIGKATALKGDALDQFTAYCNSRIKVEKHYNDYEIINQIQILYLRYREEHPTEEE